MNDPTGAPGRPSSAAAPGEPAGFVLGHRPGLDGVRGVAIVLVLAYHSIYGERFLPGGFIGVDIFFVLSGFLITSILLEEWGRRSGISFRQFYRRRALRLFPALWVVMAAQLTYSLAIHSPRRPELKMLTAIFFYFGNWSWKFGVYLPSTMGQMWTLAIEEQFYLVWPLLLLGLMRSRNRRLTVGVMVGLIAVAFFSRLALWQSGVFWTKITAQTEVRLDALIIGALLSYALKIGWRTPRRIGAYGLAAGAAIGVLALVIHPWSGWMFQGGYTVVAVAAALLIWAALDRGTLVGRAMAVRPARVLGRLSYSLYLWHGLIFVAVQREWPHWPGVARLVAGVGLTAIAATLSYRFVEQPFLRRKNTVAGVGEGTGTGTGVGRPAAGPEAPRTRGVASPADTAASAAGSVPADTR
jgi:peptidoglycan/LPS O-acetylase OafA/YrhL